MDNLTDTEIECLKKIENKTKDIKLKQAITDIVKKREYEDILLEELEQFIDHFEKNVEVKCKTEIEDTPLLRSLYRDFVQNIYEPNSIDKMAINTKNELKSQLEKQLTDEQIVLLRAIEYCYVRKEEYITEESFIYGYAMASQMKLESINKYPKKEPVSNTEN